MDVETLLSDVEDAVGEPPVEVQVIDAKGGRRWSVPLDSLRFFLPVANWVLDGGLEGGLVGSEVSSQSAQDHVNYTMICLIV